MNFIHQCEPSKRVVFDAGVILLCALLLTLPVYLWGIPGGADMPQHFQFAQTFYDSLREGILYPSWSGETNYGYGDVGIRFYPPLTYYVLSFFRLLAGNWYEGTCLAIVFFFFLSGIGAYKWAREFTGENSALFGACFYLLVPYHISQIYQATMIAEFAGAAILPFCFLYVTRICQDGRWADLWRLSAAFALLILTHLPTTVMASFALTIYVLFSLRKADYVQTILKLSGAVSISLMLSSFYWVKMGAELDWVKHNSETYISGHFSYLINFGFSWLGGLFGIELKPSNPYLNNMILLLLGILIPNLVLHFLKVKEQKTRPFYNLLAMTMFSLFMVLPLSLFFWNNLTILQKIQFPWRWLIFVSLGASMLVAATFETMVAYYKTPRRYLTLLAAGLMFVCIPYNYLRIVNNLFLTPKDFFIGMVERLKKGPTNDCWWAAWMPSEFSENDSRVVSKLNFLPAKIVVSERTFAIEKWNSTERIFTINEGAAGQAQIATMFYPHWKATVNGQEAAVSPTETGFISFPIPAEKSEVRLYFQEPPHVIVAFYISGFAWILLLGLLIKTRRSTP